MPRPPKYTDDDIAEAIDSLIAAGKEVNPSRVKQRLGGGNIQRIKVVIDQAIRHPVGADGEAANLPNPVLAELRRHDNQLLKQARTLAKNLWRIAFDEASKYRQEQDAASRHRIAVMERELSATAEEKRQLQQTVSDERLKWSEITREKDQLAEQCAQLGAALRNAESDLRASERMISVFERAQRQDREEIRLLQKRIEEIVAEIATLKAKK